MRSARLLLLALILTLTAACGGDPAEQEDLTLPTAPAVATISAAKTGPTSSVAITLGFAAQAYKRQIYQPLIDRFNQENPDVQIQFVSLDAIIRDGTNYTFDTRKIVSAADTAELFGVGPDDVKNGYVLNLQPLIEADTSFQRDDFYPGALNPNEVGIYIVPQTIRVQLLGYNKDLWDAAGLTAPKPGWEWNEFAAAAEQLAKKRGKDVAVYGYVGWNGPQQALFAEIAARGLNFTPQTDASKLAVAITRVANLRDSGAVFAPRQKVGEAGSSATWETMQKLISEQQAGMWPAEMTFFQGPNGKPAFPIGVATMPVGGSPIGGGGEGLVISGGTQHPEAAWRWLSFLSRQPLDSPFNDQTNPGTVPARPSLAESSGFWKGLDAETAAAVRYTLEHNTAAAPRDIREYNAVNAALDALTEGKDANTAASDMLSAFKQGSTPNVASSATAAPAAPIVVATPERQVLAEGATKITFGVAYDPGNYAPLAKAFNQAHPETFVDIKVVTPAANGLSLGDMAKSADCFTWFNQLDQENANQVLDLQPLIDADGTFPRDDYSQALLAAYKQGGALRGLPFEVQYLVLVYNKALFEKAGVAEPTVEWTLDDLMQAAEQLSNGNENDRVYGFSSNSSQDIFYMLSANGVALTRGSGANEQPAFTDPAVVEALQRYLSTLKNISPASNITGYSQNDSGDNTSLLRHQGRIGMWLQYGGNTASLDSNQEGNVTLGIAPPPFAKHASPAIAMFSSGMFISATTQHAQACWQWMNYLAGESSAVEYGFPARLSIAQSTAFTNTAPQGSADVIKAYRRLLTGEATTPPWFQSEIDFYWLFRAINNSLQGNGALDSELSDAQRLTEEFLTCTRAGGKGPACAKQVDPDYAGWSNVEQKASQ